MRKSALLATVAALGLLAAPALTARAAEVANYQNVSQARLDQPEPGNWLMVRGNYAGWGYSPLKQITSDNVKELVPV